MMGTAALRFDPLVEAAVLGRYGVDTLDPRVSLRRVRVLVKALPAEAWPWHLMDAPTQRQAPAAPEGKRVASWSALADAVSGGAR